MCVYLSPQLQKPNHLKRLLNIRDLLTKAHCAPLCVHFHKLVFGDHLLEAAEGGFDIFARGDVVGDVVDEGGYGDPAGVCLGCYCAGALLDMVCKGYAYGTGQGRRARRGRDDFFSSLTCLVGVFSAIVKGLESRQTDSAL